MHTHPRIQSCLPRVVEHDCREVFTGLGEIGHGETECAEQTTLNHAIRKNEKDTMSNLNVGEGRKLAVCVCVCVKGKQTVKETDLSLFTQFGCLFRMVESEHVGPAQQDDSTLEQRCLRKYMQKSRIGKNT